MLKSLEIINKNKYDIVNYGSCVIEENEYETIKADLEVLQIIYIKNVSLSRIKFFIGREDSYILKQYNDMVFAKSDELTLEELVKIKQWLLSNKVGDNHD